MNSMDTVYDFIFEDSAEIHGVFHTIFIKNSLESLMNSMDTVYIFIFEDSASI